MILFLLLYFCKKEMQEYLYNTSAPSGNVIKEYLRYKGNTLTLRL